MTLIEWLRNQPNVKIEVIIDSSNNKRVVFTHNIYKNSPFTSPLSWSSAFTNDEILKDPHTTTWLKGITGAREIHTWSY